MTETDLTHYLLTAFPGVETSENFGYIFFFYGSDRMLPFATLIAADNEYDHISNLDRPGVFRLNLGVSRATFQNLFGPDKVDVSAYDYTALDTFMPHPEYAAQSFLCILSPSDITFQNTLRPLLAEAYELAAKKATKRQNA
jgi:hypothetical protein